jgi:hypothetical protein
LYLKVYNISEADFIKEEQLLIKQDVNKTEDSSIKNIFQEF